MSSNSIKFQVQCKITNLREKNQRLHKCSKWRNSGRLIGIVDGR